MIRIYTHKSNGFCNGVERAVNVAMNCESNGKIFTYGELVHNKYVIDALKDKGIEAVNNLECVQKNDTLIIRAHGAPLSVYEECEKRGINVVDCTCGYVRKVQEKARSYYRDGYAILLFGDKNHPEIIGINGWCENSAVTSEGGNVEIDAEKVLVLFQTTFLKEKISECIKNINAKHVKTLEVFNSICYTTVDRQSFVNYASSVSDVLVVVGDKRSSNTNKLEETAKKKGIKCVRIESPDEINYSDFINCKSISIIAGASTPRELVKEVLSVMVANEKNDLVEVIEKDSASINEAGKDEACLNGKCEAVSDTNKVSNTAEKELSGDESEFAQAVDKIPAKFKPMRAGQKLIGTVSDISAEGVSVSFGAKRDGFIPNEELTLDGDIEGAKAKLNTGDTIETLVKSTDRSVILTKKELDAIKRDDELIDAINEGAEFSCVIQKVIKGGLLGKLGSYSVFVPASQIRNGYVKNLEQYVNKKLRLIKLEIDNTRKKIVASQKELLAIEKRSKEDKFWSNLEVGEVVEGKVMRFASFGAFINVRGFDCLAHLSDLSWLNIKEPNEVIELNNTYDFVVLKMDREANRVSVGLKQLQQHPWDYAVEKYAIGTTTKGKVARILPYGAFIELEKGIDGLLHISNVSWDWISDINQVLKVGDEIDVCVIDFDVERRRLTLSRKATMEQPVVPVEAIEGTRN